MDMFEFKRRASERVAREAAASRALDRTLHADVSAELKESFVQYSAALDAADFARKTLQAVTRIGPLQEGIDAVLLNGADAYGPELATAERHKRAGAMLAHSARNYACLSGSFDRAELRNDFCRLLDLPREQPAAATGTKA